MRILFLLILLCPLFIKAQVNLNLGLKANYTFNGNANDVSGSGFHGSVQGATLTTDRFGNPNSAYYFDGLNDRIVVTDNGGLATPSFSLVYYFLTESSTQYQNCIGKINYSDGNGGSYNSGIFPTGTKHYFGTLGSMGNCFVWTTSTLSYTMFSPNSIQTNQWHCAVNTFENGVQKMYLDGVLVNQETIPIANATFCANTNFVMGSWWEGDPYRFKGKLDDVRYYNRALNATEAAAFCSLNEDSIIVNKYTPVISLDLCKNIINVEDAAEFNIGDTVLMIQMKGAAIDSTNTAAFGSITDYKNAGNYEFNYVKSKNGNSIELLNILIRQYDFPNGKVQLIRVPYYINANFDKVVTCLPWDGSKGGVLALNVANTLTLNANIDISNRGFRGGIPVRNVNYVCDVDSFYVVNINGAYAAAKGEGIANSNRLYARGKLANGGGGGNSTNAGGAGGGNAGTGGAGGKQFVHVVPVCNSNFTNGGIGGVGLNYSNAANKIFPGGGGGAGHDNEAMTAKAGNGGAIAIISANSIVPNSYSIVSNGGTPVNFTPGTQEDGRSGGGSGGTVLLNYTTLTAALPVEVKGGNGDFTTASNPTTGVHGPGGGGGGGMVWINKPAFEAQLTTAMAGGINGVNINLGNNAWGATPGTAGSRLTNLVLPITTTPFKANIDSVRFSPVATACKTYNFNGLGYTNAHPVASWSWFFGDTGTAATQNTSHTYANEGTYTVKLVITDINGCKDSLTKTIVISCAAAPIPCNNWLNTPVPASYAEIGDLDVPGNTMTVEAVFNRTTPYSGGNLYAGNLVSKHNHPTTVNYLLRPNSAEITTTNGYFITQAPCEIELNKTYHVAMVYDGSTLKFYRNGFLMSQTPVTGNLFQNDLRTRIGWLDFTPLNESFIGYINEVRIWNVARTQTQLQTYMNSTLPGPTTQTGLLGYYSFDNLSNKQGNATFNATLAGAAAINQTNTNCPLVVDFCAIAAPDSLIINNYTPVISLDICKNIINVEDATAFNIGDTVLMIQMKGAVIDSTNTAAFGNITNLKNAGNYEFNYVKSKTGNSVELLNVLIRQYDLPDGKVQLIRVPYYSNVNFDKVLTCLPWDGNKGGVLAFNVQDTVTLGANMDVSGRGFRGGIDPFSSPGNTYYCYENNFFYPPNPDLASGKGEGIATVSAAKSFGKGALANGGGGGNSHNSGGGGGSNGASGGSGGYSFEGSPCNATVPFNNRGIGGYPLTYSNAQNRIFLGGGGGAGHSNNPEAFEAKGGNGAGIIIVTADKIKANTNKIIANGNNGKECGTNTGGCHEGMGGGGAAGTILLNINTYLDNTVTEVKGGKGADMTSAGNLRLGPGGGGGGGVSWVKQAVSPANLSIINTGGIAGICTGYANNPWGATAGTNGNTPGSLILPITTTLFKPNIDSVRFTPDATSCSAFDFDGFGYTNTHPVATWQWYFGDGGTANTQNTSHTYSTSGTFNVKLVVTDINGCKDSISRTVNTNTINVFAGNDASYCSNTAVTHTLNGSGSGSGFNWQPAALLNDNSIANPTATISSTTKFYLTQTGPSGCSAIDSVIITINPVPVISTLSDTSTCSNTTLQLNASGAETYVWAPATSVSNPGIANPVFTGTSDETLSITGTNAEGCSASSSFDVVVKAAPIVNSIPDSILCGPQPIVLTTNGAQTYSWSPANDLSNAGIANPVFTGTTGTYNYTVTGTAANGCIASDIVNITVNPVPAVTSFADTAVCSNRSLQLLATGAASYIWSPAAAVSNPNISNPVFTATGNQTITVTGTNAQGCSDTHSFNVSYNIAPVITTIPDSTICNTQSIVLTTTGAQTWSWSPAINLSDPAIASPVFSGTTGNTYTVTGTAANGCSNTDVVVIDTRTPGVFNTPPDKTLCINSSVVLDGNNGNDVSYQWSPSATLSNTNAINPTATPVVAGNNIYTVLIAETVCNSSRSFQVNVLVNPLPNVTASRTNDLDCSIRSTGLTASGAVSYTWTPAATLNNPSIATPVASPTANTTYTVTGTDANGCKNDGTVTVLVKGTEGRFDIPNAFTPNGDGKNDCFGVKHWGDASVFHFMIFNRWGEKVFETKDINNCWDGWYKGQPADLGNYVYYIKSVNFCGEQVKKGNVLLIR
jgi:gliding motility-associated-like protein